MTENTPKNTPLIHSSHPWEVRPIGVTVNDHSAYAIFQEGAKESGGRICHIPQSDTKPTRANATLIASAPLMLETLRYVLMRLENDLQEFMVQNISGDTLDEEAQFMAEELEADIALVRLAVNSAAGVVI